MKRLASAVAVSAALVLTPVGLAGTASAQTFYPNCDAAFAAGVSNIPIGAPGYRPALDSNKNGVACEKDGAGSGSGSNDSSGSNDDTSSGTGQDESAATSDSTRPDQVTVVPEGGAETGDGSTAPAAGWWIGGGLLAAAAGLIGVRRVRTHA